MAKGFKHGPGGTSLNFDVKRYDSEDALLAATPKENTIGIITTTPIAGWIFSATEPEGLAEGMVWILTGVSSPVEFNALKKNGIDVYPTSVKQYVNGAWVDLTAKSYQNGEWVEWWNGELYDAGNQYEEFTGGWEFNTSLKVRGIANPDTRSKFYSGYIYVAEPSVVNTKKKIDLSRHSKLCFDVDVESAADGDRFGVFENFNNKEFYNYESVYAASVQSSKTGRNTIKLDISSLKTSYYVAICTSESNRKVYKVWLE